MIDLVRERVTQMRPEKPVVNGIRVDPPEEILAKFNDAIKLVVRIIDGMDDAAFLAPVKDQPPIQTKFGLLTVCVAHLNNHVGQMAITIACRTWQPS